MFEDKKLLTNLRLKILDVFLREHYPLVFTKYTPLKVGIFEDILIENPAIDPIFLSRFLHFHTNKTKYLKILARHNYRYDLQGVSVQPITLLEKIHHIRKYQKHLEHKAAFQERKANNIIAKVFKNEMVEDISGE
jgi:sRNA-binding protein